MRHRRTGKVLKRKKDQREALLNSLARAIIINKKIKTTEARAKAVRPYIEHMIALERRGTLSAHKIVISRVGKDTATRIKRDVVPVMKDRQSGFVRIIKAGSRKGDSAPMRYISLVEAR